MISEAVRLLFPERRWISIAPASRSSSLAAHLPPSHRKPYDLTLVLPMYNVGPYVTQCLYSVLHQIGICHQIVIVNDGSTDDGIDKVLEVLDHRRHEHVLVVDQANRGLSAARNTGTCFALGTYIAFLDTDDIMAPNAYAGIVAFASENQLDAVFFRSLIFDEGQGTFDPFYDADIWDRLLKGRRRVVTSAAQEPELLRLEPNANTRMVRRELMEPLDLYYPEGVHFEDPPVHIRLLLGVRRVGLLNQHLYAYRVNRPGKITDQRSRRRFDILEILDLTLAAAQGCRASPAQAAEILSALLRISYWCGTMTALHDRYEFFDDLGRRWTQVPRTWSASYRARYRQDLTSMIAVWAIERRDPLFLVRMSLGQRPILGLIRFVWAERRFGAVVYLSINAGRRTLGRLVRMVNSKQPG